jgi:hypothetical protein
MSYAMELSPAGFREMLVDLDLLGMKIGRAWLRAQFYARRFGSLPSGERALASILGVTVRYLSEVAWPLLADRLVLSEDGARYYDPEITSAAVRRAADKPSADVSAQRSKAAQTRWERQRQQTEMLMPIGSDQHAKPDANGMQNHANGMQTDAKVPMISTTDASGLHPLLARADSPPPPSSSLLPSSVQAESLPSEGVLGEGESRASGDAQPMQTDATEHAPGYANRMAKAGTLAPLPADWQPSSAAMGDCAKAGYNPAVTVAEFCAHYRANGETRADWDAAFIRWIQRQPEFDARKPAGGAQMPRQKAPNEPGSGMDFMVDQIRRFGGRQL